MTEIIKSNFGRWYAQTKIGELSFDHKPDEKEIEAAIEKLGAVEKEIPQQPITELTVEVAQEYLERKYAEFVAEKREAKTPAETKLELWLKPASGKPIDEIEIKGGK